METILSENVLQARALSDLYDAQLTILDVNTKNEVSLFAARCC